jgi:MFS family permease
MFLNYATQGAFVPLFSLRLQNLGFSPVEIGWACSTQALAALAGPLVVGQIADRYFPAQRCLTVCALLGGVLLWEIASLTTPLAVFLASLAIWLVLSPANTLCAALSFAHLADPERDFGPVRLWGTIGWVAANWVLLLNFFVLGDEPERLSDIFRLAGMLACALSVYALTLPHTPPRKHTESWLAPLVAFRLLRGRSFRVFWVCSFGVCVTFPFFMQLAPLLLQHHGIPRRWIGPTMTLAQSMEIVALALLPMLLLRLSIRGTMLLGLLAWTGLHATLALGQPIGLVVASLSLNGLCICCFIVAGQVFVNSRARGDVRASAQALFAFINALGLLSGNLLVGWVHQLVNKDFPATFTVGTFIAGFLVLLFLIGFREQRVEGVVVASAATPAMDAEKRHSKSTPPVT